MALNLDTPWSAAANVVNDLIDKLVPDTNAAAKAKADAAQALQAQYIATLGASVAVDQAQAPTNTAEAQSGSFWVSGGRPAIIWICAAGLGYAMLGQPVLSWLSAGWLHWPPAPEINLEALLTLLFALLGISTQRMIERLNGKVPPGK